MNATELRERLDDLIIELDRLDNMLDLPISDMTVGEYEQEREKFLDEFVQSIAATLGVGTCELHDCEGSFSAVNKPVWRCDCGAFMTQYTDATTYHKPRFCPNCGRKVKR